MNSVLRRPFNVQCGRCEHVWAPLYLPMAMMLASKILKSTTCPRCSAGSADLFVASTRQPAPAAALKAENPHE